MTEVVQQFVLGESDYALIDPIMDAATAVFERNGGLHTAQIALLLGAILAEFKAMSQREAAGIALQALEVRRTILSWKEPQAMND